MLFFSHQHHADLN